MYYSNCTLGPPNIPGETASIASSSTSASALRSEFAALGLTTPPPKPAHPPSVTPEPVDDSWLNPLFFNQWHMIFSG